jgi:hypothetical protein
MFSQEDMEVLPQGRSLVKKKKFFQEVGVEPKNKKVLLKNKGLVRKKYRFFQSLEGLSKKK